MFQDPGMLFLIADRKSTGINVLFQAGSPPFCSWVMSLGSSSSAMGKERWDMAMWERLLQWRLNWECMAAALGVTGSSATSNDCMEVGRTIVGTSEVTGAALHEHYKGGRKQQLLFCMRLPIHETMSFWGLVEVKVSLMGQEIAAQGVFYSFFLNMSICVSLAILTTQLDPVLSTSVTWGRKPHTKLSSLLPRSPPYSPSPNPHSTAPFLNLVKSWFLSTGVNEDGCHFGH